MCSRGKRPGRPEAAGASPARPLRQLTIDVGAGAGQRALQSVCVIQLACLAGSSHRQAAGASAGCIEVVSGGTGEAGGRGGVAGEAGCEGGEAGWGEEGLAGVSNGRRWLQGREAGEVPPVVGAAGCCSQRHVQCTALQEPNSNNSRLTSTPDCGTRHTLAGGCAGGDGGSVHVVTRAPHNPCIQAQTAAFATPLQTLLCCWVGH